MSYTLWCGAADGQQHLPCIYPIDPAAHIWDHIPSQEEQIEIVTSPPITAETATGRWGPQHARFYGEVFTPTACHFDKHDPNNERPDWPSHWHPQFAGKHVSIGGWNNTPQEYPVVKRLYRCSVHGTPPAHVTIRYSPRREQDWDRLKNDKFRHFHLERDAENIARLFGELPIPHEIPYWLRYVNGWVLNRPAPRTTHDTW